MFKTMAITKKSAALIAAGVLTLSGLGLSAPAAYAMPDGGFIVACTMTVNGTTYYGATGDEIVITNKDGTKTTYKCDGSQWTKKTTIASTVGTRTFSSGTSVVATGSR